MKSKKDLPTVGNNKNDRIAAIARGVTGAVPIAGSFLSEIVTEIIPNQRLDRVEAYLLFLAQEFEKYGIDRHQKITENDTFLIEEGAYQAVRTLTDARRKQIAKCVRYGISTEKINKLRERKLLTILGELDDDDIVLLDAYGSGGWDKFERIRPPPPVINAPQEVHEQNEFYDASKEKLVRLQLIKFKANMAFKEIPEFDKFSGEPKGSHNITLLGRLILERIGLPDT